MLVNLRDQFGMKFKHDPLASLQIHWRSTWSARRRIDKSRGKAKVSQCCASWLRHNLPITRPSPHGDPLSSLKRSLREGSDGQSNGSKWIHSTCSQEQSIVLEYLPCALEST